MAIQKCSFLTLNVRGLKNRIKRKSIFSYLKDQTVTFIYCKKRSLNQKMKQYGKMNGKVTFSFLMEQITVKEFVFS